MGLASLHVDWSTPRTWFVTARLLELAAAVAVVGAVYHTWLAFDLATQTYANTGEPLPEGPPFLDRVATFALSGFGFGFGQAPLMALLACTLLLAVLAVLHFAQPVSNSALLRWEVFVVWTSATLLTAALLASLVVGLVKGDPNQPPAGTVTFDTGPGAAAQLLTGAAAPAVGALLLATVALWWLKLPAEFEEPTGEPAGANRARRQAPAPDANTDDIALDDVELIEPVERLRPRRGADGDGSTASGYDDYFRRF
jgi:hypothetical protein